MTTYEAARWSSAKEGIARLSKLYGELRTVSMNQEDEQRIDRAEKATQEYSAAAQSWVEDDAKIRTAILPELRKVDETVMATAQAAENDAWKASDESTASVTGIVGASKTIIVVAMIVGVLVGVGLAIVISKGISAALSA